MVLRVDNGRLKSYLKSLGTSELQRRVITSEQRVEDHEATIIEIKRCIDRELEAAALAKDVVDDRYAKKDHSPEYK